MIPTPGVVEAIFTFGAPAAAQPSLDNLQSRDRCFSGLRSYNEDITGKDARQVDAASISNSFMHAMMPMVALRREGDSQYVLCPGQPALPNNHSGRVTADWRLHWENDYAPRLKHIQVRGEDYRDAEPFVTAKKFVVLAYKSYDSTKHTKEAIEERMPGWRLVARETRIQGSGATYDEDPVMLVQDSKSLDCAIVFTGTNNADSELTSTTGTPSLSYCGFQHVHAGYRTELRDITTALWPRLQPKLARCQKVSCVGHSLGGSLCEIFAACANSKRIGDPDYQRQMWALTRPEAMEEIIQGGIVNLPGAEKRCEEPPCPKIA